MGCCCSAPDHKSETIQPPEAAGKDVLDVSHPGAVVAAALQENRGVEDAASGPPSVRRSEDVLPDREQRPRTRVIYIVYHSVNGLVEQLVRTFERGAASTGVEVSCHRIPELLPKAARANLGVVDRARDHPVISPDFLPEAIGLVFAFPVRFGMMCAPMKAFFDATGDVWQDEELSGVPVTLITSTEPNMGGSQTALLSAATQLVHHNMIYVPDSSSSQLAAGTDTEKGAGPWGSGTVADQQSMISSHELAAAERQGVHFAHVAAKLATTLM